MVLAGSGGMQACTSFRYHLCSELVSVARLSGRHSAQALDGNLEEIGAWSALLLMQSALRIRTKVRVIVKNHELIGCVRSCTFDGLLGFFIEIVLDPESRWSEKWFVPERLFALRPSMRYFTEPAPKVPENFLLSETAHIAVATGAG
jgi:hypothetical protein